MGARRADCGRDGAREGGAGTGAGRAGLGGAAAEEESKAAGVGVGAEGTGLAARGLAGVVQVLMPDGAGRPS